MAFSLSSTLMCLLFIAPLLCSFHSSLASRLLQESKKSSAKELGLDSSSLFQPSHPALPTFQNHMLIPNPNSALPTFQDNMLIPNPNPAFPFPGLPGLPKLPPIPPIPTFPFIPTIPPYNPYLHPIPPIPGSAKKSTDSAVSTDEAITATP